MSRYNGGRYKGTGGRSGRPVRPTYRAPPNPGIEKDNKKREQEQKQTKDRWDYEELEKYVMQVLGLKPDPAFTQEFRRTARMFQMGIVARIVQRQLGEDQEVAVYGHRDKDGTYTHYTVSDPHAPQLGIPGNLGPKNRELVPGDYDKLTVTAGPNNKGKEHETCFTVPGGTGLEHRTLNGIPGAPGCPRPNPPAPKKTPSIPARPLFAPGRMLQSTPDREPSIGERLERGERINTDTLDKPTREALDGRWVA